ncbi:hypothetical protein K2C03_004518, partial [Vibrio vulnificus]|nr:hypothetical protein [Vibrio vulnificus]
EKMAESDEFYRESQARIHRVFGSYLGLVAWKRGLDCVVIERDALTKLLKLKQIKEKRIGWIKDDVKSMFKYVKTTNYTQSGTHASIYLSRKPFPRSKGESLWASMSTEQRIEKFAEVGIVAAEVSVPSEKKLLSKMALIANGVRQVI